MKQLTRLQMKKVFGGVSTTKKCFMECTSDGNQYAELLGTACTIDADCSSSKNCESGFSKTFKCFLN